VTQTASTLPSSTTLHDPKDLQALVKDAIASKTPIVDYGVAHTGLGNPPPAAATRLTFGSPADSHGIIEHYSRDFTVRAWAGATLADLAVGLAKDNQFFPIDADPDLTLGEVINHNVFNAQRIGYNAIRDISLGLHYIDGEGRDIHVGGRTVKNVAGYDVTRLMVGSLGQLGLVYEATVRTYAIPQHVTGAAAVLQNLSALDSLIPTLLQSSASPARMHASYNPGQNTFTLHCGYHGSPKACDVQSTSLKHKLAGLASDITLTQTNLADDQAFLTGTRAWRRSAQALLKLIVPPASTGKTADALAALAIPGLHIDALPAHGVIFTGGNLTVSQATTLDAAALKLIAPESGLKAWYTRPSGANLLPFAPAQSDWPIITRLKATMDPHNLFNPGRLV
jgi:FAD/FMN-containing dehydrogenase